MKENMHPSKQMEEAVSGCGRTRESVVLRSLTEAIQGLIAVRQDRHQVQRMNGKRGGRLSQAGDESKDEWRATRAGGLHKPDEKQCEQRVLGVLRELGVFHSERVTAWREAVREGAHMLTKYQPGARHQQQVSTTDSFGDAFQSVGEDIENIMNKMNALITKLDEETIKVSTEAASTVNATFQKNINPEATEVPRDDDDNLKSQEPLESDTGPKQEIEDDGDNQWHPMSPPDIEHTSHTRFSSSDCNGFEETQEELMVKSQESNNEEGEEGGSQTDIMEAQKEDTNKNGRGKKNIDWITVGLTGHQEDSHSSVADACFIRAPTGVAGLLRCELADALSCLIVTGSEELVSRVIRVQVQDQGANFSFPVTVVVPFCVRYRGNCRDVTVKIIDGERRASYVTPITTEGTYGGQRGTFAEVRVYSLGLFAVVSCLKRENYTVPTKGLSLKLSMDPRICLNYLPGSFIAPVMAQCVIQPLDAVLVAAVKSKSDANQLLVSTSPLLYLTHPSHQRLRRPLTVTVPCPPNPESRRHTGGQGQERDSRTGPVGSSPRWNQPASHRRRILGASVRSQEMSNELLAVLGSRDKQWSVLDEVTVRNQQNGLVSFELTQNFDRLLVVRLLSPVPPGLPASLAEQLEECVRCHAVTLLLLRRPQEPHTVLAAALPSRDLTWELSKLRALGYGAEGPSSEICMCEGDQLLLRFSGNITSTGTHSDRLNVAHGRLSFHSQQKNHLLVHLTEVDPFGNYSSPHYKGTAVFYKVTRGHVEWPGDRPVPTDTKLLGDPVCKLSLTLPKKVRIINRPVTARVKLCCEETDSLSDSLLLWLSGELSEEDVALLVLSLRLRRSAAQLVKLRAGDSVSAQAYHVLGMWRRGLPSAGHPQPRAFQLAHCLAKSGRADLARELMLRHAALPTRQQGTPKQQGSFQK